MASSITPLQTEQRAIGAYLGLAIGDALGATVEFMTAREIAHEYGVHDSICGGGWLKLRAGDVTDDTTMSLALGESILQQGSVNAGMVAEAFSQWMVRKPVDIGATVKRGITHFRYSGVPAVSESEWDAGNGACMRTLPVALATLDCDDGVVIQASRAQAHVTHNNALSDAATECVIKMIQLALRGGDKAQLLDCARQQLVGAYPVFEYRGGRLETPGAYIVETLQAVLQALEETDSFETCLLNIVNRGGDADTTGAIAGMLAGSLYGVQAIPARWLDALNEAIRSECEQQAVALLQLGPDSKPYDCATAQTREAVNA